jgi:hypothetical protein
MKLNYLTKKLSSVGRWITTTIFCLSAIAFVWQGAGFSQNLALANTGDNLIVVADAGDTVKDKVDRDAGRAKNFIRDTADKVERTANRNADKVEDATDNDGTFIERKAKRDKARIEYRAERDAAKTQKAVDKTQNAIERTVDNIKDALN